MSEFMKIECPLSMFSDNDLVVLSAAVQMWHSHGFEAIAILTDCMVQSEIQRRQHNRTHPEAVQPAAYGRIRLDDWSDADVAASLAFIWGFSATANPKLGELVDAIGDAFIEVACDRLRSSSDPRNATSFEERNKPQDGEPKTSITDSSEN
jgi:hypothetical protein